jgi:tRNA pseudouridine38-40 synthase
MAQRRNYLLKLAYDGGEFAGWQRLPGRERSVQEEVELALRRALGDDALASGPPFEIVGAGRTDRGVHAEGQAASFHARTELGPQAIVAALNRELPPDIACGSCREVDPRFHARFRVKGKTYRYRLHLGEEADPRLRRWSLHVPLPARGGLDLDAMRDAARALVGERDFAALTNAKEGATRRRLDALRIEVLPAAAGYGGPLAALRGKGLAAGPGGAPDAGLAGRAAAAAGSGLSAGLDSGTGAAESAGCLVDLCFDGPGFLYNQVRIMAACLLAAGEGRLDARGLEAILASRDRSRAPGALGAFGLCLAVVRY